MEDASRDFDGFLISVLMFPGFIFPKSSLKCVLMIQEPNFELIDVDQETAQSTGSMLPENLLRKCAASRAARYGRLLSKTFEEKKKIQVASLLFTHISTKCWGLVQNIYGCLLI